MLKGWKTILFNIFAAVIPFLELIAMVGGMPELRNIIPNEYMPYYILGIALVNLTLRHVTDTKVGYK